nr:ORF1 [Fusarium pseudograminearum fusarivirus 1]
MPDDLNVKSPDSIKMQFAHYLLNWPTWLIRIIATLWLLSFILPLFLLLTVLPFGVFAVAIAFFIQGGILTWAVFLFFVPFFVIICSKFWRRAIAKEKALRDALGPAAFLWYDEEKTVAGVVLRPVVMAGWDLIVPAAGDALRSALPAQWQAVIGDFPMSTDELASWSWSYLIDFADWMTCGPAVGVVMFDMAVLARLFALHRLSFRLAKRVIFLSALAFSLIWAASPEFLLGCAFALDHFIMLVSSGTLGEWLRWRLTHLVVVLAVWALDVSTVSRKYTPVAFGQLGGRGRHRNFAGLFREKLMQATVFVSDLGLPHYIRGTRPMTRQGLDESLDVLRELGWPVNVRTNDNVAEVTDRLGFREWLLCGTDWEQGIRNLKTYTDELLDDLRLHAVEFRRTEEYASLDNELKSTSRYFRSPRYDFPDLELDDVWFLVKDTFQHSKLTPFNYIIQMWEKKYGLGAFFRKPGSKAKLSRRDFIKSIGGLKPFKQLWRRTFEYATVIVPVSAVSVKGEALPPKKWMEDKVRTIIGTPLVHYIMTTIWNYEPNHRFAWVSTPTKIGMPLNGYWLSDLYFRHSRCQHHFAGDMSSFDSTLSGKVIELVKAVRKKGYEHHRDHDRICNLIDVAYDQLEHQLLNTTSTGQVYKKGTGLTTGHSSTSADNSLGIAILYLFAWKELTGLSAREFVHFNELSDYGDDHVLSFLATKPAAWNFKNIQKVMARWGVENRLEASGSLDSIPFLSKFSRRLTAEDRAVFAKYQVPLPKRVVYHDRDRLLGKMVARIKTSDPRYRAKRLLSYLSLTAHHEDIYNGISRVLTRSSTMKRAIKQMGVNIPTYQKVLSDWYHPTTHSVTDVFDEVAGEANDAGLVFSYGQVTWVDSFLGTLSMVPDFVNPAIFNFGYDRLLQIQARRWLSWPIEFLSAQNGVSSSSELRSMIGKSCYSSLIVDVFSQAFEPTSASSHLARHWVYLFWFWSSRSAARSSWLSGITYKLNQVQFTLNGTINAEFAVIGWKLADLCVIAACSLIPPTPFLAPICDIMLPRVDLLINTIVGVFIGLFWTNVPPNYKEVTHLVRQLPSMRGPLLVQAGTGTGKSTSFIKHLSLVVGARYNKIIVIEPRSALVRSLVPYVRDTLLVDATGCTAGYDFDPTRKVWYMTPQEAILRHRHTFDRGNLIVVDECHLGEAAYRVIQPFLKSQSHLDSIYLTATPSAFNFEQCEASVELNIANVWHVAVDHPVSRAAEVGAYLKDYRALVLDCLRGLPRISKVLVFYPSKEGAVSFADSIDRPVSFLNSGSHDTTGSVILSTSVADAGLTIPAVDLVISPCLDYTTTGFGLEVTYALLNQMQIKQRQGRTGRTNNGRFVFLQGPNLRLQTMDSFQALPENIVTSLMSNGVTLPQIRGLDPGLEAQFARSFQHSTGLPGPIVDSALENFDKVWSNFSYWREGRMLQSINAMASEVQEVLFDHLAAGNVSVSSFLSEGDVLAASRDFAAGLAAIKSGYEWDLTAFDGALTKLQSLTAGKAPIEGALPYEYAAAIDQSLSRQEHEFNAKSFWQAT